METWEYDIVICDAHLVIGEKLQLVRRMCRTKSSPAVIVATADTNITLDFIRIVTPALCVQDIIYKPIVVSEALVQIERVIEYKRAIAK
jgi:DNA-binding response OmpR family regulator